MVNNTPKTKPIVEMQPILKPCFKIKRGHWKTCRAKNAPYLGRTSPYPPFHWVPPPRCIYITVSSPVSHNFSRKENKKKDIGEASQNVSHGSRSISWEWNIHGKMDTTFFKLLRLSGTKGRVSGAHFLRVGRPPRTMKSTINMNHITVMSSSGQRISHANRNLSAMVQR